MPGNWGLIDKDTPEDAYRKLSYHDEDGEDLVLVFSDEFETSGRTFYPGEYSLFRTMLTSTYIIQTGDDPVSLVA